MAWVLPTRISQNLVSDELPKSTDSPLHMQQAPWLGRSLLASEICSFLETRNHQRHQGSHHGWWLYLTPQLSRLNWARHLQGFFFRSLWTATVCNKTEAISSTQREIYFLKQAQYLKKWIKEESGELCIYYLTYTWHFPEASISALVCFGWPN